MNILFYFAHPVITYVLWFISFVLITYAGYYFVIALFAFKPYQPANPSEPKNKFAVIIAARNESLVIGNLIRSLKMQDYPPDLFEVFVIPNNCNDNTREVALNSGAAVLDCTADVKSKGEVLSFAFDYFLNQRNEFDAYCIFDADNLADTNFLKEMNNLLCAGMHVAQGLRESKNPNDSVISSCYTIYYNNLNRFYNHARNAIGLSSVVNGTGFMLSAEVIRQLGGWHTQTITEDLEFTALCALHGFRIHWAPKAVFYDEQPITFRQSWHQRKRWSSGMQQCLAKYWNTLLCSALRRKNIASADILMMFIATHMQILGFLSFLTTFTLTVLHISYQLFPQTDLAFRLLVSFDTSYLSTVIIAATALLLEGKNPLKLIRGILFTWVFLISWIPINCICLIHKTNHWHPIEHIRNVSLKDIIALPME